ncbi:hypothetical protein QGM71_12210 [Virgibacillus sp. C22-A2]|uniref:Uncharacterized protein n=1 Tax=Virgibacillus tibetensis TaxID=3042313 RepID=A0ABU6KGE1_9BACI|nr:hypothetical protein [Virgibacillus sp. C22-A2]
MKGSIYLIKTSDQKLVPALCLNSLEKYLILAQLRKATFEDISNTQNKAKMGKFNKGKPEREHIKIREKYEIDTVYIGQPQGLKSKSVVMVRKLHKVKKHDLIKGCKGNGGRG